MFELFKIEYDTFVQVSNVASEPPISVKILVVLVLSRTKNVYNVI